MIIEGYGGRAGNHDNEPLTFADGDKGYPVTLYGCIDRLGSYWFNDPLPVKKCANPKCDRFYRPRAEGDDFCNERCDPLNKFTKIGDKEDD